ncbi:MAG: hypothetical protein COV01_02580 [Candidatus Taylorbacteria bacterium CG10_big_fil_rev_8_21_14_0_10_41_48]|uniref:Uncharacterized protein n=1 Tax=Candidatus Taylorbacteria bacterium CG10_big_fil_rev_8_21_14_0_10_41_48 TaxID=1975024 RepID=A0A2M8LBY4_9BACT|nr:MAG: hypothetical protein COV01_02580 [Candidatus Taylorbacteria bacterium CG10_big_fil_rev_8_21_14_0_10_41_48]
MRFISYTRGSTLLDTLIGVSLMLLVFVGITAVFRLSVDVVINNKARAGALALSQERVEFIRSLSYDDVGVVGGIPPGDIEQEESLSLNGVSYTRKTLVRYVDDPKDGEGIADENGITADSKEVKVTVMWDVKNGTRSTSLTTRVSPTGVEQAIPGGTLSIYVVDANVQPVSGALVSIVNENVSPSVSVSVLTNSYGEATFIGAPEGVGYEIVVTKVGQSTARTYSADSENTSPSPGHLTVVNGATTASTFAIDLLSNKTVYTYQAPKEITWTDPFDDDDLLASSTDTVVASGHLRLTGPGNQNKPGFAESIAITSTRLKEWKELSWVDEEPEGTEVRYSILYDSGGGVFDPVPDTDLPGNETGFTTAPVDLSGLAISTYNLLRIHSTLSSSVVNETPRVDTYSLSYIEERELLPNIVFTMRGNKTIGVDGLENSIYKYDEDVSSGAAGIFSDGSIEWDTYTITIDGLTTGYDISESCETQPVFIAPSDNKTVSLVLSPHTANSLLVDVKNVSGDMLEDAEVRLYRGAYDTTQETSSCGQSFFGGLSQGTVLDGDAYSIDVTLPGYEPFTSVDDVDASGASRFSVVLEVI